MDEAVLRRLAECVSRLVPDAALDGRSLKSMIDKYGSTALSAGSPNHGVASLCEAIEIYKRLEKGEAGD